MLSAKAYSQAYSYKEYKEAEDYSDLMTAFANDIEQVEENYLKYGYPNRKRKFDPKDREEAERHSICRPYESMLDTSVDHLMDFVPSPAEPPAIKKIYEKRINGWNDTHANRLETKIENAKQIIAWFQKQYPIILRKSFYYEDSFIYVGNGQFAKLPTNSNYDLLAKILFRDIHKVWTEDELIDELAHAKRISLETEEYYELKKTSLKRSCQLINDKVSDKNGKPTKLILYSKQSIRFDLELFHQIDRVSHR